jgi:hypothetical protein
MVSQVCYMHLEKIPAERLKNGCSRKCLANLNINTNGAHNAIYDCEILAKLLQTFKIMNQMLLANAMHFSVKTILQSRKPNYQQLINFSTVEEYHGANN